MSYCIINSTTATKEDAILISNELINKNLIACCNIIPGITSIYKWNNEIVEDSECLMIIKTKQELYAKVEEEIKKMHKYDIPEIICMPIVNGSEEYLNWIRIHTS